MFRISPFALYYAVRLGLRSASKQTYNFKEYLRSLTFLVAFPDNAKRDSGLPNVKRDGIRRGLTLGEWIIVTLTSAIFGLAHYLAASGWEVGKITSSTLAGLMFSLSYLMFGFPAPIILHWFFNYYFCVFEIAAKIYQGPFELLQDIIGFSVQIVGFAVILISSIYFLGKTLGNVLEPQIQNA